MPTCEADKQFLKRTFHERQAYKHCDLQCPPRFRYFDIINRGATGGALEARAPVYITLA